MNQSFNNVLIGNIVRTSYNNPLQIYLNKENNQLSLFSNILETEMFNSILSSTKQGKIKLLKNIVVGSYIYNIERKLKTGPVYCRSKFSFGQVLQVLDNKILVNLPSKKKKMLDKKVKVFLLNNINLIKQKDDPKKYKSKAGVSR